MPLSSIILISLGTLVALAALVVILRGGGKLQQDLKAMAEANGWSYRHGQAGPGLGRETVIAPPEGGWQLRLHQPPTSSSGGARTRASTQWTAPEPYLKSGLTLLGPGLATSSADLNMMLKMLDGPMGQMALSMMIGDLAKHASGLQVVERPEAGSLLLATPGNETALDPAVGDAGLETGFGNREKDRPILIASPDGLQLRLRRLPRGAEEALSLIELGRGLAARFKN